MKLSLQWLRELVNPPVDNAAMAQAFNELGFEVESLEPAAEQFSGVVVGYIKSAEQHPDADRLRVCQVDVGDTELKQIVCGAPNARAGIKVAVAKVGATLPGDFKIKKAKLRGVESQGMICSSKELGISDEHIGIMELADDAPVGADFVDYLGLDDEIIEVDITANRGDALCAVGLAREIAAKYQLQLPGDARRHADNSESTAHKQQDLTITLSDAKACPRYTCRRIQGIRKDATTPVWMSERLRRSGVRSIHPVVDILNYVMFEMGQPMHAFDAHKLKGNIRVCHASKGEKFAALDEQTYTLSTNDLIIADDENTLALAGVIGGASSAVSDDTTNLLLESAYFSPLSVRQSARAHGLQTDSSYRFERGIDTAITERALQRATDLIVKICGGKASDIIKQEKTECLPKPATMSVTADEVNACLGTAISSEQIKDYLARLGFVAKSATQFVAPTWRQDMSITEDLIEEVARLHGLDHIEAKAPVRALMPQFIPMEEQMVRRFSDALQTMNYREAITYSFIDPALHKALFGNQKALQVANPISSDLASMRTSIWPALLQSLLYNVNRQQTQVRLFESGLSFIPQGKKLNQPHQLAGLAYDKEQPIEFFAVKGEVEALLDLYRLKDRAEWQVLEHPLLHPGQAAQAVVDGVVVAELGMLHPQQARALDIGKAVGLFALNIKAMEQVLAPIRYQAVPKFPAVKRDLALIVARELQSAKITSTIKAAGAEALSAAEIFDVYQGEGIDFNKKSVAVRLTFQALERTLTDEDVNAMIEQIMTALQTHCQAELRA